MSSPPSLRLGWVGLGNMGLGMATNIQKHLSKTGYPSLRFWNRTISRGAPLRDIGGVPCTSVTELAESCDVIFVSVSDDEVLSSVVNEAISSGSVEGKIFVDTTTVHPSTTTSVSTIVHATGASYVAAPVFGATPLAESGQLLMAVAGPPDALQTVSPFLQGVVARNVIQVGDEPGKALLLKTTSNFITAGLHYLLSEAHVLAEKSGLPAPVLEALVGENFGLYMHGVSQRLTSGRYYPALGEAPTSGLELGMKDVGHGLGIAKEVGMELKIAELSMGCMQEAKEFGDDKGRKMDSTSVFGVVRRRAGVGFESEVVKTRDESEGKV